ncbi:GntR family transcriptional regulator [Mycoplasma procyoni]|uniref:GntR family transcriptional regulator n=1 Tax=Mycoplasma procyoni TaxID=568784 RepID=UPI00197C4434|nr:GntR family transcriptional regulator [Mycoplasma procyoni]MBN3534606.1 GntR family transcriptional regulator [Mycoplasma procyoni]
MSKIKKVISYLSEMIKSGQIEPNKLIPSENELSKTLAVSRTTVRVALKQLVSSRVLIPFQGKGYVYNESNNVLGSFLEVYGECAQSVHLKTIFHADFSEELKSNGWYEIKKIRYYKDLPFIYTIQKVPKSIINKVGQEKAEDSVYSAFKESGINIKFAKKKIKLIKVSEEIKKYFHVSASHLIKLVSYTYSDKNELLEISINYYLNSFEWEFIEYHSLD